MLFLYFVRRRKSANSHNICVWNSCKQGGGGSEEYDQNQPNKDGGRLYLQLPFYYNYHQCCNCLFNIVEKFYSNKRLLEPEFVLRHKPEEKNPPSLIRTAQCGPGSQRGGWRSHRLLFSLISPLLADWEAERHAEGLLAHKVFPLFPQTPSCQIQ